MNIENGRHLKVVGFFDVRSVWRVVQHGFIAAIEVSLEALYLMQSVVLPLLCGAQLSETSWFNRVFLKRLRVTVMVA